MRVLRVSYSQAIRCERLEKLSYGHGTIALGHIIDYPDKNAIPVQFSHKVVTRDAKQQTA